MYRHDEPTRHALAPEASRRRKRLAVVWSSVAFAAALVAAAEASRRAWGRALVGFVAAAVAGVVARALARRLRVALTLQRSALTVADADGVRTVTADQVRSVTASEIVPDDVVLRDHKGAVLAVLPREVAPAEPLLGWLRERQAAGVVPIDRVAWCLLALGSVACAAAWGTWLAGPAVNAYGAGALLAVLLASLVRINRSPAAYFASEDRENSNLGAVLIPAGGLLFNAGVNLRHTLDKVSLVGASVPIALGFAVLLRRWWRFVEPPPRAVRVVLLVSLSLCSYGVAQLTDTLFDPFDAVAGVEGTLHRPEGTLFVRFTYDGEERETLFAPPLVSGYHGEAGHRVRVTVGRGLWGVPYVREVGPP